MGNAIKDSDKESQGCPSDGIAPDEEKCSSVHRHVLVAGIARALPDGISGTLRADFSDRRTAHT